MEVKKVLIELQHDKTKIMTCTLSEDSDQPGHPTSAVHFLGSKGPNDSSCEIVKTD